MCGACLKGLLQFFNLVQGASPLFRMKIVTEITLGT